MKKRRGVGITLLLVMLGLLLLVGAGRLRQPIGQQRLDLGFDTVDPVADSEITTHLRIPTAALFTFRSLIINYLWIRADNLKNDGQYFDALPLRRMICALQPNIAAVWKYQAWDMAYNISVGLPTAPERWRWVRGGFELLRDEGLRYNPRDSELYRELGWIFQHKIGGVTDDYHLYYKERLALDMMVVMGPGRVTNEVLQALAESPRLWRDLIQDPNVAGVVQALQKAQPEFNSDEALREGLLRYTEAGLNTYLRLQEPAYKFTPEFDQTIQAHINHPGLERLDTFVRARHLREHWKLEPSRLLAINQKYGPVDYEDNTKHESLDWRLPWPHSIYWATEGLSYVEAKTFDWITLQRMIYHSLQDLFLNGSLQIISVAPPVAPERRPGQEVLEKKIDTGRLALFTSQDLRMFPIAYQATLDIINAFRETGDRDPGGIGDGSINLGKAGVVNLYLAGHRKMAQRYLNDLRGREPDNKSFQGSLEEFVRAFMKQQVSSLSPYDARNYVIGFLRDSWTRFGMRDDENAVIREAWAKQILQEYERQFTNPEDRIQLPEFGELKWTALNDLFADASVSPLIKNVVIQRIRIENPEAFQKITSEWDKQRKLQNGEKSTNP